MNSEVNFEGVNVGPKLDFILESNFVQPGCWKWVTFKTPFPCYIKPLLAPPPKKKQLNKQNQKGH